MAKFGGLYKGLELDDEANKIEEKRSHKIWLYPVIWLMRRTLFTVISVTLFDYPAL